MLDSVLMTSLRYRSSENIRWQKKSDMEEQNYEHGHTSRAPPVRR